MFSWEIFLSVVAAILVARLINGITRSVYWMLGPDAIGGMYQINQQLAAIIMQFAAIRTRLEADN